MTQNETLLTVLYSLPAYAALICALLLARMVLLGESPFKSGILRIVILANLLFFVVWMSFMARTLLPQLYVLLRPFAYSVCLLVYTVTYHFVFMVTKCNASEKFCKAHYLLPLAGFAVMLADMFTVPHNIRLSLLGLGAAATEGHKWYVALHHLAAPLLLCTNLVYSLLAFYRIRHYHKAVISCAAGENRNAAGWLYHFAFATFATFMVSVCVFLFTKSISQPPVWTVLITAVLSVLKNVTLTYNVLRKDIVIIDVEQENTPCTPAEF